MRQKFVQSSLMKKIENFLLERGLLCNLCREFIDTDKAHKCDSCLECGKKDLPYCLLCSDCFTKRQGSS